MMKRKYLLIMLSLLLPAFAIATACGKRETASEPEDISQPQPTEPLSVTPETVDIGVVQTPEPAAVTPTPTPVPTPTPDPYLQNVEKKEYREGFYYVPLNDALRKRITGLSYPKDTKSCLVSFDELRYLRILYVDFSGEEHVGELIVHKELADEVLEIFAELYDNRYALTSVRLVDDFGERADDTKSMEADNTSSFCYRTVSGSEKLSRHSYGAAIDINPMRNPYIRPDGSVSPSNGREYADRSKDFPGKIDKHDLCYKIFTRHGWSWGGDFKDSKDYQHFSKEVER